MAAEVRRRTRAALLRADASDRPTTPRRCSRGSGWCACSSTPTPPLGVGLSGSADPSVAALLTSPAPAATRLAPHDASRGSPGLALAAGIARFVTRKLVRSSGGVSRLAALARAISLTSFRSIAAKPRVTAGLCFAGSIYGSRRKIRRELLCIDVRLRVIFVCRMGLEAPDLCAHDATTSPGSRWLDHQQPCLIPPQLLSFPLVLFRGPNRPLVQDLPRDELCRFDGCPFDGCPLLGVPGALLSTRMPQVSFPWEKKPGFTAALSAGSIGADSTGSLEYAREPTFSSTYPRRRPSGCPLTRMTCLC